MTTPESNVPVYFADFVVRFGEFRDENQKQHGELTEKIVMTENRLIKWVIGGMAAMTTILLGGMAAAVGVLTLILSD